MTQRYIAIIPARGGSKGVPGKNIRPLGGIPLIAHSIRQAQQAGFIDRVFVNTDSDEIAGTAREYGAEVPFMRPPRLATDRTTTLDTIIHGLKEYSTLCDFDVALLLQPTSPFRTIRDFNAVRDVMEAGSGAAATYSPAQEHPARMKVITNGRVCDVLPEADSLRRQDLADVVVRNGAIYAFRRTMPETSGTLLPANHVPVMMGPFGAVNIDTPFDLLLAQSLWESAWGGDMQKDMKNIDER